MNDYLCISVCMPPWEGNSARYTAAAGWLKGAAAQKKDCEREAKAKFVASVWGADFVQFLAALQLSCLGGCTDETE